MKPRIVILSAFLTPFRSGAEACAEEVPLRLTDQFDFTIITARLRKDLPKKDLLQGKIPVIRVGLGVPFDKWLYPFIAPFAARKIKPAIVHGILETFAGQALSFCKYICPRAKRLLTLQTTNRKFRKGSIIRSADRVTEISKHLAGVAGFLGRENTNVIPNGIDYQEIREACKKHSKIPGRILFVGRLERMKGVDLLLKAFTQTYTEHCELHIVGDGSLRSELENLAKEQCIQDRVIFKGRLPSKDVYKEYAEAEIFCGLSRSEALGNVFFEAMAGGCALVFTNIEGILQVPGVTLRRLEGNKRVGQGVAYDPLKEEGTVREAAQAISWYLSHKAQIALHGANGVQIAKEYDWKLIANRYAEIYKSFTLPTS